MALKLGSLYVSLSAQTSGFAKSMAAATKTMERFAKDVKRVSGEVAQVSGVMAALGGAAVKLAASVDGPTANAVGKLEHSSKLLAVQIADVLLPAVREMTAIFRQAASVVAGLSPEVKKQVASFAVLAVQLAVGAKALSLFAGLASNVFGVLRAGFALVSGVGVGPLLAIVAGIGLVVGAVLLLHRAWRKNWGGIQDVTKEVLGWFRDAFSQLATFFGKVWDFLVDGAANFVETLLTVIDVMQEVTGKKLINTGGLRSGFEGLWKDLKSGQFLSEAFTFGQSVGGAVVDGIKEEWGALKQELGLDGLLKGGKTIGLGRGAQSTGPRVSGASAIQGSGINAGAGFLHEMEKAAKDGAKHNSALEKARFLELRNRLAIASDLEKQKRIAAAIRTGTTGDLTGSARKEADSQMDETMDAAVGAGSWGEAQAILKEGLQGSLTFGAELSVWAQRMSGIVGAAGKQLLGAVGDLVDSIVQGAKAGGVWGAFVAAIMEIAKKTESALKFLGVAMAFVEELAAMVEPLVKPIFDALTNLLGGIISMIGPLFTALQPFFDAIGKLIDNLGPVISAIGYVVQALAPVIEVIGKVVGVIVDLLKPIFDIIGGVLKVIATVILGIIIALNEIAAAFGDEAAKAESARLKGIVDKMWAPGSAEAEAADRAAAAARLRAKADEDAADAAQKVAESLSNVPAGYRLANARYQADLGITSSNAFASAGTAGAGGTTVNFYGDITTDAETIEDLARDAKKEAIRDRGQRTGNPSRGNGGRD